MTKKAPARSPMNRPKPKAKLGNVARMRRLGGDGRPEHEPPDRDPTRDEPAVPTTPNPWFPDISIHFYGLNWDLESLPPGSVRQQLATALTNAFPGRSARSAFDGNYPGVDTSTSLSIGLWASTTRPEYDSARRRGLIAMRSPGRRAMSAEALISVAYLRDMIVRAVPSSIPIKVNNDITLNLNLVSSSVSVVLPSTLHAVASYSGWIASLGAIDPTVDTSITFGASSGNLTLSATPLNANDYGAGQLILHNLFNPFGATVLTLAAIGLVGFAVHNVGSNLPGLPGLPPLSLPNLSSLLPRAIPIDLLKMTLVYQTPDIVTRGAFAGTPTGTALNPGPVVGATPGLQVLRLPFAWDVVPRVPALTVSGPASVGLPGGNAQVNYRANTSDMVNPTFAWTVGGVVQPGQSGANASLKLDAHTTLAGTPRNFTIGVRAVDGLVPALTAASTLTTHGMVIRPNNEEKDSPGGPDGRWDH